jgi:hypothetical protein
MIAAMALLLLGLAASLPAAVATTAYVSQTSGTYNGQGTISLMKALADQNVTRIELVGDYSAGDEFVPLQGASFPVQRCDDSVTAASSMHAARPQHSSATCQVPAPCVRLSAAACAGFARSEAHLVRLML